MPTILGGAGGAIGGDLAKALKGYGRNLNSEFQFILS